MGCRREEEIIELMPTRIRRKKKKSKKVWLIIIILILLIVGFSILGIIALMK